MNPDFLQSIWTFAVTVACYLAVATELISPKFETMPAEDVDQAIAIYDEMIRLDPESPKAYLRRGYAWVVRQDFDKAIADYDTAICIDPDSAGPYLLRGTAWKELKRFDYALADVNEAIRLDPKFRNAYLHRALIWGQTQEFDKGLADCDEAIRLDPSYAPSYSERGCIRMSKGNLTLALADFDEAIRLDPNDAISYGNRGCVYVEQKKTELAFADFVESIRLNPNYPKPYYNRSLIHHSRSEWDLAIRDCNEAIRLEPTKASIYYCRGRSFQLKGDNLQAIADFDKVLGLTPDDFNAYVHRGTAWANRNRWTDAISDFSNALRLKPENAETLDLRARCLFSISSFDLAIADASEAIRLEPGRASFHMHRGSILVSRSLKRDLKDDLNQAIADYSEAARLDPHDALLFTNRAIAFYNQKNFGLATLDAITADELNPRQIAADHMKDVANLSKQAADRILVGRNDENQEDLTFASALFDRGVAHYVLKRDETAIKDLSEAINLDPGSSLSYAFRGRIHLRNKQWDSAIQDFNSAIRLKPDDAAIWMARGEARAARKEWVTACDDFREAIRLDQRLIRAFAHRGAAWQAMQEWEEAIADYDQVTHGSPLYVHAPKDRAPTAPVATTTATNDAKTDSKIVNVFEMVARPSKGIFSHPTETASSGAAGFFSNLPQAITTTTQKIGETRTAQPATNQTPSPGAIAGSDVELDPLYLRAFQNRAECHEAMNAWAKAIADYQRLIELTPSEGLAYRRIAWLKATCIAPDVRSGVDAVSFAIQAKQRSKHTEPEDLIVLAAAYAEAGDFVMAVDYQSKACELVVRSSEREYQARRQHFASLEFQQSLNDDNIPNTKSSAAIDALTQSCEKSGWSDAELIETLADAYADAGQFSQAIEFHEKAYAIVSEERTKPLLKRLELYQAGKPYRRSAQLTAKIISIRR